jgi:outer membrane receptor protein involved in Fe transport
LNYLKYNYYSENEASGALEKLLNSSGSTQLFQGYFQSKYLFSDRLILNAGLHYAYFAISSDHSLEPRLGLTLKLQNNQKLSFGYGLHSKNENLPVYFIEREQPDGRIYMPNISLKMTRSSHFVVGYEKMLRKDLQIKTEVYLQYMGNLPVPNNPDKFWAPIFGGAFPGDTLANIGKGRNYGVELTFQKFFTDGYYFLVTNSLFDSKYKPANGSWYNTKYNINYITNLVGGKELNWKENKLLGINFKLIWAGGKRLIPIDLPASIEKGETVYLMDEIYSKKGPDYFRIDLGFKLHFFREKAEHILSLDIQNVTNRRNTLAIEFNPETESIKDYPLAGIIPIFAYRLEF